MSNIDKHIGKRLFSRRGLLCLTRKDLGDRVGVSPQQIQKYESGNSSLKASKLIAIADALDIDPSYFFMDFLKDEYKPNDNVTGQNSTPNNNGILENVNNIMNSEETMRLFNLYYRIKDETVREKFLDFLDGITKTNAVASRKTNYTHKFEDQPQG
jgi:transcriptional regulator with XRE-family HTH domain